MLNPVDLDIAELELDRFSLKIREERLEKQYKRYIKTHSMRDFLYIYSIALGSFWLYLIFIHVFGEEYENFDYEIMRYTGGALMTCLLFFHWANRNKSSINKGY